MAYEVFGEDLAFLPMTLSGAMKEELSDMLTYSMTRLSPTKDSAGRAVVIMSPRRRVRSMYSTAQQKRAWWYLMEVLASDPEVRRNGAVLIYNGEALQPSMFDPAFIRWRLQSLANFPCVQFKANHFCNVPFVASRVMLPALKFMLSRESRNRIIVHNTSPNHVDSFAKFSLPPDPAKVHH